MEDMVCPHTNMVYVAGLPADVTEDALAEFFGTIGIIKIDKKHNKKKVWLYRDKATGALKGDGTVTYDDPYAAGAAVEWFNGKEWKGATLQVSLAEGKNVATVDPRKYSGGNTGYGDRGYGRGRGRGGYGDRGGGYGDRGGGYGDRGGGYGGDRGRGDYGDRGGGYGGGGRGYGDRGGGYGERRGRDYDRDDRYGDRGHYNSRGGGRGGGGGGYGQGYAQQQGGQAGAHGGQQQQQQQQQQQYDPELAKQWEEYYRSQGYDMSQYQGGQQQGGAGADGERAGYQDAGQRRPEDGGGPPKPRESRDGDWPCDSCGNTNFGWREKCNRCANSRPPGYGGGGRGRGRGRGRSDDGPGMGRGGRVVAAPQGPSGMFAPDDWPCPSCGNVNWARRQSCNKCNTPKPGTFDMKREGQGGGFKEVDAEQLEESRRRRQRRRDDDGEDDGEMYDEFGRLKKKYRQGDRGDREKAALARIHSGDR